jgi:hypothetical protein
MTDYQASVNPHQPWTEDGSAEVRPLDPYPSPETRILPLENRPVQTHTLSRSDYPKGLVVIKEGNPPAGATATLAMRASDGDAITVLDDEAREWPNGFVAWFTD